jgi:hypothetical protein
MSVVILYCDREFLDRLDSFGGAWAGLDRPIRRLAQLGALCGDPLRLFLPVFGVSRDVGFQCRCCWRVVVAWNGGRACEGTERHVKLVEG